MRSHDGKLVAYGENTIKSNSYYDYNGTRNYLDPVNLVGSEL